MHIAHLARAENELLASLLEDKLRFVFREHVRGAVVLLRQLFLSLHHFAGEADDHVVLIGLSVDRDGTECCASDLHRLILVPKCQCPSRKISYSHFDSRSMRDSNAWYEGRKRGMQPNGKRLAPRPLQDSERLDSHGPHVRSYCLISRVPDLHARTCCSAREGCARAR